jgi:hypothetical protein
MAHQAAASHSKTPAAAPKPRAKAPSPTPSTTTASTTATTTSPPKPKYYNPALNPDRNALRQTTRDPIKTTANSYKPEKRNANAQLRALIPSLVAPTTTTTTTSNNTTRDPNKIFVVIPTANKSKTRLITTHLDQHAAKPAPVHLAYHQIPAESCVGEQPYDADGPRGAFNRVVNAVRALAASDTHRRALVAGGFGTLLVAAVENYIWRKPEGAKIVRKTMRNGRPVMVARRVPVDYGVVVFCVIPLVGGGGDLERNAVVKWAVGVSGGVTVPREYYDDAQKYGFEDEKTKRQGKVTVGKVLGANIPGLDDADWHKELAGVSRYDLLSGAMKEMVVPWPVVKTAGSK